MCCPCVKKKNTHTAPEYSRVLRSCSGAAPEYSGVAPKKHALLRSTPEYSGVAPEYSEKNLHYSGVLRSTPKKTCTAPEYSGVALKLLRSNVATLFMCHSDGGELGGEGRRGSSASVLFLFIKLLHREMDAKKTHFSGYVHTLKVND
jgi:hypothetical protein